MNYELIGTVVGVIGLLVAIGTYFQTRRTGQPLLRVDSVAVLQEESSRPEGVPIGLRIGITNTGDGTATRVDARAWLFMATGTKFTVPSGKPLPAHFATHLHSLKAGELATLIAHRSGKAVDQGKIPVFDSEAVPVVKFALEYRGPFGRKLVEVGVLTAPPEGFSIGGYDHEPPK